MGFFSAIKKIFTAPEEAAPQAEELARQGAADAVKDEFPDKFIGTFAYQYTRKAPRFARPRPNVIVRLCSIEL